MKRTTRDRVLLALAIVCTMNSMPVTAAVGGKPAYVPTTQVRPFSNRLIVKLKPAVTAQVMSVQQTQAELSRPLSVDVIQQLQAMAGAPMSDLRATVNGAHVMMLNGVQNQQAVAQAIAGISKLPNVEYVEEDRIETIQVVPTDPYYTTGPTGYPGLWGMQAVSAVSGTSSGLAGNYGADFQAAWATSTGAGVVVAVVDTGITPHVDIVGPGGTVSPATGNLASPGYDFISDCRLRGSCAATLSPASAVVAASPDATDSGDFISSSDSTTVGSVFYGFPVSNSSWHGTHVAGTIAAIGNNGVGVIGGAYDARILPVRALGKGGGWSSDISEAIMWAAGVHPTIPNPNPARVINLSLGSTNQCSAFPTRQAAITAAVNAGAVVVVAAGNENQDVANSMSANCSNVISVAAVGRDGSRAAYSNYSSPSSNTTNPTKVTLAAQGSDVISGYQSFDPGILSTINAASQVVDTTAAGSAYAYYQGTSMATPHVSAVVALMLSHNPALTPARVKEILSTPAALTPFPSFVSGWATWDCSLNKNCGAGILNAPRALQNSTTTAPAASSGGGGGGCSVMPVGANPDVSLLLALLAVAGYWFRRRAVRERSAD